MLRLLLLFLSAAIWLPGEFLQLEAVSAESVMLEERSSCCHLCLQTDQLMLVYHLQIVVLLPDSGSHLMCLLVSGAAGQITVLSINTELNISSCPITYFGQKYEQVYVSKTTG